MTGWWRPLGWRGILFSLIKMVASVAIFRFWSWLLKNRHLGGDHVNCSDIRLINVECVMSHENQKYVTLFQHNWSEAHRTAKRLNMSLVRLSDEFPLSSFALVNADDDLLDKIDAFRVRFADLQDCIGNKLFRNLLKLEHESPISMLDVLNMMEKRQIIESSSQWRTLREVRNAFAHDYPESENERASALNAAWTQAPVLFVILERLQAYLEALGVVVEGDFDANK